MAQIQVVVVTPESTTVDETADEDLIDVAYIGLHALKNRAAAKKGFHFERIREIGTNLTGNVDETMWRGRILNISSNRDTREIIITAEGLAATLRDYASNFGRRFCGNGNFNRHNRLKDHRLCFRHE